jgi:DNA-binding ferritin-like protein
MEINVITTSAVSSSLDPTRIFGIILSKATSTLRMLHWYVLDHNAHEILGDLYGDLSDLFDKLQEEIIGTSKEYDVIFPLHDIKCIQIEQIEMYQSNQNIIDHYFETVNTIKNLLTSLEFNNYINNVKSGIGNTKEEIISRINKSNYLLSMINL